MSSPREQKITELEIIISDPDKASAELASYIKSHVTAEGEYELTYQIGGLQSAVRINQGPSSVEVLHYNTRHLPATEPLIKGIKEGLSEFKFTPEEHFTDISGKKRTALARDENAAHYRPEEPINLHQAFNEINKYLTIKKSPVKSEERKEEEGLLSKSMFSLFRSHKTPSTRPTEHKQPYITPAPTNKQRRQ